jgi:recombination protein RecA
MPPKKVKTLADVLRAERTSKLVFSGPDIRSLKSTRLSTGIFIMDMCTGGGIPRGKTTQIWGAKSCGKSTTASRIAGSFLKTFKNSAALYLDFEGTYEEPWASNFVEDMSRLWVVQPDFAEQGIDIVKKACEAPELGLIIVDSLAQMIPLYDADVSATKDSRASQPKIINKLFRKILPQMSVARRSGNSITFICINQVRSKMNTSSKFGPQVGKAGGYMQEHVPSMEIRLYLEKYDKKSKAIYNFCVEKNKVGGRPKQVGTFTVNLKDGSVDETAVIAAYARRFGLIRPVGKSWVIDGTTRVCKLLEDTVSVIEEDRKLRTSLTQKMIAKVAADHSIIVDEEDPSNEAPVEESEVIE